MSTYTPYSDIYGGSQAGERDPPSRRRTQEYDRSQDYGRPRDYGQRSAYDHYYSPSDQYDTRRYDPPARYSKSPRRDLAQRDISARTNIPEGYYGTPRRRRSSTNSSQDARPSHSRPRKSRNAEKNSDIYGDWDSDRDSYRTRDQQSQRRGDQRAQSETGMKDELKKGLQSFDLKSFDGLLAGAAGAGLGAITARHFGPTNHFKEGEKKGYNWTLIGGSVAGALAGNAAVGALNKKTGGGEEKEEDKSYEAQWRDGGREKYEEQHDQDQQGQGQQQSQQGQQSQQQQYQR